MGRLLLGWLLAIMASMLGILWSFYVDYPTGPAVVVMLGLFLVFSSLVYYIQHAPVKARAVANVAGIAAFVLFFFFALTHFKKTAPVASAIKMAPIDMLLEEVKRGEEVHQLDAVTHLGDLRDPNIVPALTDLLSRTRSEQVVEATAEALRKQKDPRAIPALRSAAKKNYDDFLQLSLGKAQLAEGDPEGISTVIQVLKNDGASLARQEANEILEKQIGGGFGYQPGKSAAENKVALQRIEEWWKREGVKLKWDGKAQKFRS
jgi:hypothetical protein